VKAKLQQYAEFDTPKCICQDIFLLDRNEEITTMASITYESVSERARRLGCTLTNVYSKLAAGRINGARKVDGRWQIPIQQSAPSQGAPVRDFKVAACGEKPDEE
jgi:hypothetical protein